MLVLSFSLAACGFHLRGNLPGGGHEPALEMRISTKNGDYNQLYRHLTQDFQPSKTAPLELTILDESWSNRSLTFDTTANVVEYELIYRVSYTLGIDTGEGPLRNKMLELTRVYQADTNNPLANRAEQRQLVDDMTRRAASQLMARARAIAGQ